MEPLRMEKFVPLERLDYLRGLSTKQLQAALATEKTRLEREGIALEERALRALLIWQVPCIERNQEYAHDVLLFCSRCIGCNLTTHTHTHMHSTDMYA